MGNAYTVNLGISGICSESIPMGRLKNETTERYETAGHSRLFDSKK